MKLLVLAVGILAAVSEPRSSVVKAALERAGHVGKYAKGLALVSSVRNGMTADKVQAILGEADVVSEDLGFAAYSYFDYGVVVYTNDKGKVYAKEFNPLKIRR
ncbi:MAG TPA: hypothetical protein VG013_14020 [Gemmataceae bacterium]|jgi:hypothetical protein|nr:hypothetical protein [Gemmataceae bacterium]